MVGLEDVVAGGQILRDDFKDTYAGTLKEGKKRAQISDLRRTSRKRSIHIRYLCDFEFKIYRQQGGRLPHQSTDKYIYINFLIFSS